MVEANARVVCPRCGWHETTPIVHGQPRPDLDKVPVSRRRSMRAWLRGMDVKDRVCRKCGHQWNVGIGS